jgi:hypothetical protein
VLLVKPCFAGNLQAQFGHMLGVERRMRIAGIDGPAEGVGHLVHDK